MSSREGFKGGGGCLVVLSAVEEGNGTVQFGYQGDLWTVSLYQF